MGLRPSHRVAKQEVEEVASRCRPPSGAAALLRAAAAAGRQHRRGRARCRAGRGGARQVAERSGGQVEDLLEVSSREARRPAGQGRHRAAGAAGAAAGVGAGCPVVAAVLVVAGLRALPPCRRGRPSAADSAAAGRVTQGRVGRAVRAHGRVVRRRAEVLVDPGLVRAEPGNAVGRSCMMLVVVPDRRGRHPGLTGRRVVAAREVAARAGATS